MVKFIGDTDCFGSVYVISTLDILFLAFGEDHIPLSLF